jgi:hypothetical protein
MSIVLIYIDVHLRVLIVIQDSVYNSKYEITNFVDICKLEFEFEFESEIDVGKCNLSCSLTRYIYMCVCVCVCICAWRALLEQNYKSHRRHWRINHHQRSNRVICGLDILYVGFVVVDLYSLPSIRHVGHAIGLFLFWV